MCEGGCLHDVRINSANLQNDIGLVTTQSLSESSSDLRDFQRVGQTIVKEVALFVR